MSLDRYLKKIQNKSEQVSSAAGMGFAIDSFPEKKKQKKSPILRPIYPKKLTEGSDIRHKRILIDLDRTIHRYSKGFGNGTLYDVPMQDAKTALEIIKKKGYEIVIFSARPCLANRDSREEALEQRKLIKEWLDKWGIPYDRISCIKLDAIAIIDDRAIQFNTWQQALEDLKKAEEKE